MGYGPVIAFDVPTMTSDTTLSTYVNLGKAWNKISLAIPSMTSGCNVYLQASDEADGTYTRVYHGPTTTSAAVGAWNVDSSVTNCIVPANNVHLQYLKVELSTAMTAATANFKIICAD